MTTYTATYSPDDNKLRLYASTRLDAETYARVKTAGFSWAPKQELFVAPMWTPGREDLLIELAGEIGDEDTGLVDRAEDRAERFEDYSEKRAADAASAHAAVERITDGIPLGQPILVGHHSERHARKDAERIRSGMTKAVRMWETSTYWKARAAGAIQHAKYKELPGVRHRRIKTIEADKRKAERANAESQKWLTAWTLPGLTLEQARCISNVCSLSVSRDERGIYTSAYDVLRDDPPKWTVEQVQEVARRVYPAALARRARWLAHYDNRLAYERAMLAEQIGAEAATPNAMAERFAFAPGGKVLIGRRNEWLTILRVNRVGGVVNSLTTTPPAAVTWTGQWKHGVEEVQDYQAPTAETAARVKKATTLAPLCNYPGDGFAHMTKTEWDAKSADYKNTKHIKATATAGVHRVRHAMLAGCKLAFVYLTDAKRTDPPAPVPPSEPADAPAFVREFVAPPVREERPAPAADLFGAQVDAMKQTLKAGVRVVAAPQLFPTPDALAAEMVALAGILPEHRVLEPSAGTGVLLRAIGDAPDKVAVEINQSLFQGITRAHQSGLHAYHADFLDCTVDWLNGLFDRVVMNPPFIDGADIKHIKHAVAFLKPGGRLVALCADGPRQRDQLRPLATTWRSLPPGTFKEAGTMVNVALLTIDAA